MANIGLYKMRGITSKIALILILGILGVIVTSAGNMLIRSWTEKSIQIGDEGHRIVEETLRTVSLEEKFLNDNKKETLDEINKEKEDLKKTLTSSAARDKQEIAAILDQVGQALDEHDKVFTSMASNVGDTQRSMAELTESFRRIDEAMDKILSAINKEAALATVMGETLSESKQTLKESMYILSGLFRATMVNLQGLYLVADAETFQKSRQGYWKKIDLEIMNVKSQLKVINDNEYNKAWGPVPDELTSISGLGSKLFLYWKTNRDLVPKFKETGDKTVQIASTLIESTRAQIDSDRQASNLINIILIAGTLVLQIFIGILVGRSISKPIKRIIDGLTDSTRQVTQASAEVADASRILAEGTSQQAAAIEETSSSIEEMASMIRQNADNAGQCRAVMLEAQGAVSNVQEQMTGMTDAIGKISRSSEETVKIIKTIDEIAFQTNLLALNAAVEAARAGEAGAGFAVVADEVRSLALRAADAARTTNGLIENTVKAVKDGSELTRLTQDAFRKNVETSSKLGELIGEIAAASQEQAQGVEQINRAVAEMDKVTQQNAASAEESASASEEMNAQAEQMREFVGGLVALVGGNTAASYAREERVQVTASVKQKPHAASPDARRGGSGKALPHPAAGSARGGNGTGVPANREKARSREVRPEDVIPFDDKEFDDF